MFFFTDNINYVRQQWLEDGIVPRSNVRGYNQYNSITRRTEDGDCTVKQFPAFYYETYAVMRNLGIPYQGTGIGKATLQAIEWLLKPRREDLPRVDTEAYLAIQKYVCANCGTLLLNVSHEAHHQPRICESHENKIMILC